MIGHRPRFRRRLPVPAFWLGFVLVGSFWFAPLGGTPPRASVAAVTSITSSSLPSSAVPVVPDHDQARRWATEELSRAEYRNSRPSLVERALDWFFARLNRVDLPGGEGSPVLSLIVTILSVVAVLVALKTFGGPLNRTVTRPQEPVLTDPTLTAADYRRSADRAAQEGDWETAVLERFRCVVRALEERAVIDPQPGRTASEITTAALGRLPDLAGPLRIAASVFDDVRYGDGPATAEYDAQMRALDDRVSRSRAVGGRTVMTDALVPPA